MEQSIRDSGIRHMIVRLPEFYGPNVVSLTARVFAATAQHKQVVWPGDLEAYVEFVYMPDGAKAMVTAGTAPHADSETYHVPGLRTTPEGFMLRVADAFGTNMHAAAVPAFVMRIAGWFDDTAAAAADIGHLWWHPVLLDGSKYERTFGPVPMTPYEQGIAETVRWFRKSGPIKLQK